MTLGAMRPIVKQIFLLALIFFAVNVSQGARADTYGCTVMLCTASGAVPWQSVPACVPPVSQALAGLDVGIPWPTCPEAGAQNDGAHLQQEILNAIGTKNLW